MIECKQDEDCPRGEHGRKCCDENNACVECPDLHKCDNEIGRMCKSADGSSGCCTEDNQCGECPKAHRAPGSSEQNATSTLTNLHWAKAKSE